MSAVRVAGLSGGYRPGREVLRDGRCVTVDTEALWRESRAMQQSLLQRAGIVVPHRWPQIDAR